ncbi:unnamed protein product [Closterium sp. Naga37s-1]|nr:unnamed protein product [Closterium sp. Naga37s-1]
MATFTPEEVAALQQGANQRAREYFLLGGGRAPPNSNDPQSVREFIRAVFVERRYVGRNSREHSSNHASLSFILHISPHFFSHSLPTFLRPLPPHPLLPHPPILTLLIQSSPSGRTHSMDELSLRPNPLYGWFSLRLLPAAL